MKRALRSVTMKPRTTLLTFVAISCLGISTASTQTFAATTAPTDIGTLSAAQRSSLPDTTSLTFQGKTVTLGSLRLADAALQAYLRSADSLKSLVTLPPPKLVLTRSQPIAIPAPGLNAAPAYKHVSNSVRGPVDYEAACGSISVCVYIPPAIQGVTTASETTGSLHIWDPLLASDVCRADGGVMMPLGFGATMCVFTYPLSTTESVFPGKPPAMKASVSCPNGSFTTLVDPMGAASIKDSASNPQGSQPIVCAIDLYVPS